MASCRSHSSNTCLAKPSKSAKLNLLTPSSSSGEDPKPSKPSGTAGAASGKARGTTSAGRDFSRRRYLGTTSSMASPTKTSPGGPGSTRRVRTWSVWRKPLPTPSLRLMMWPSLTDGDNPMYLPSTHLSSKSPFLPGP